MSATSIDLSQIKTDALSAAATFRTLIGLGTGDTPTFKATTLSTGTITASTPALDITQTWNNNAVAFTGLKFNATDTNSSASSLLMDLQVCETSIASIRKNPSQTVPLYTGGDKTSGISIYDNNRLILVWSNTNVAAIGYGYLIFSSDQSLSWSPNSSIANPDLVITRDAANTLALRNSTNAQTYRIYNTYTDASNYERAKIAWSSNVLQIGTEKLGTGSARALELQTDGTTRLTIATTGNSIFSGNVGIQTSSPTSVLTVAGDGYFENGLRLGTGYSAIDVKTGAGGLYLSGAQGALNHVFIGSDGKTGIGTSSPSTLLHVAGATTLGGNVTISTFNIVTDTTTGTKIGTGTTQKLGFYNATPVVQPAAVVDATDAASVITQLNLLLARMRDLGLIAT